MTASEQPAPAGTATQAQRLREIPSVSAVVAALRRQGIQITEEALTRAVRFELETAREALLAGEVLNRQAIEERVVAAILALERPRLAPILNATGVIIHTNLGRAPVSDETAEAMRAAAAHAVALELEPESNERGGRMREISRLLRMLTGAEAALVVNNGAAAVLLMLATVAAGKGVVVSRSEAVEIGGGFRIPDVMRQSGARLIDVGTTNRTYVRDYAAATDESTAAYLKVHPSNFRTYGFVHAVPAVDLVALARERGVLVLEDLGSGALLDTARFGLMPEPTIGDAIAAGVDLITASGDKLLGGPQAGIIVGATPLVERVARHPLARAVRADKTTLAGVAATLRHYARGEAERRIPIWRMIGAAGDDLRLRAEAIVSQLSRDGIRATAEPVSSTIGGGSLPGEVLPSWAVVLSGTPDQDVDGLARRLRVGEPGVFGRIERDRIYLDLRTVLREDDEALTGAICGAVTS